MAAFCVRSLVRFSAALSLAGPSKLHILSSIEDSQHRFWYKLAETPNVYYCVSRGILTHYAGISPPKILSTYKDRAG